MSTAPEIYALPPDPRANACGAFFDMLKTLRGRPVTVDASAVEKMDTLVAQVILIGQKTWAADGQAFEISDPSEAMTSALIRLGLSDAIQKTGDADVD